MKKFFAILMALILTLSLGATAEESGVYALGLMDTAIVVDGETVLDLTGLEVDLGVCLTDTGLFGMLANIYAGGEYLVGGTVELKDKELSFALNEMNSKFVMDLGALGEQEIDEVLAQIKSVPMQSMISGIAQSMAQLTVSAEEIGQARLSAMSALTESLSANGGTFSISREQSEAFMAQIAEMAQSQEEAFSGVNLDLDIDEFLKLYVEAEGTVQINNGAVNMAATGLLGLNGESETIPMELSYTDDGKNAEMTLTLSEPDNGDQRIDIRFVMGYEDTASEAQQSWMSFGVEMFDAGSNETEKVFALDAFATPDADGSVNRGLVLSVEDESVLTVSLTTGTNPGGEGFSVYMNVEDTMMGVEYTGTAPVNGIRDGQLTVNVDSYYEKVEIRTGIRLQAQNADASAWQIRKDKTMDINNLSDDDMTSLQMDLIGLIGKVMPALQEKVPGLAPMLEGSLGSIMG